MLSNFFKTTWRSLLKNKAFTLINLFSLSTGMAICLLLGLYIQHELGYDNFHENGDRIYRLVFERKYPDRIALRAGIPISIGQVAKKEFPEVQDYTRVMQIAPGGLQVTIGEKIFKEKFGMAVDSNFFKIFTGHFLQGDPNTALDKPHTLVLNETTAKRFFGTPDKALNRTLLLGEKETWTVTGVVSDWPEKSQLPFSLLLSDRGLINTEKPDYIYFGPQCYLLLKPNASAKGLEAKLPSLVEKYVAPTIPEIFGESWTQFTHEGNGYRYFLQAIRDIHLHSELEDEILPAGSMQIIILFSIIAAFILILACVNFINLSSALAIQRAKEVGIRKTLGSLRSQLRTQFLAESVFFSECSIILSIGITALFTPVLGNLTGIELHFTNLLTPVAIIAIILFAAIVGAIAGIYPALILSSYDPIEVLKGKFRSSRRGIFLRNGLVVFQFCISVTLIICTIVINRQMHFMLDDNLGFRKDNIISIDGIWRLSQGHQQDYRQAFFNEIQQLPGVKNIARCTALPGDDEGGGGSTWVSLENNFSRTQHLIDADEHYIDILNLSLAKGRNFSKDMATDSFAVIINEAAAIDFGLKNPIGARIISKEPYLNPEKGQNPNIFTIIGVIKDFHYQSLHKKIAPLVIINASRFGYGSLAVNIEGKRLQSTIAGIKSIYTRFVPKDDFQYRFLDQTLAALYSAEKTQQQLFSIFSALAIIIGCIGLFGLSAYTIRQRLKEISIRKILGAMPGNIMLNLSKDFLSLVLLASFIALPLSFWVMHRWLQNFAYRIEISWWVFALAIILALGIAALTIGYHTLRAAFTNPSKNLQNE